MSLSIPILLAWLIISVVASLLADRYNRRHTKVLKEVSLKQIDQLLDNSTKEFKSFIAKRSTEFRAIHNVRDITYAYFYIKGIITTEPNIYCLLEYRRSISRFIPFIKFGLDNRTDLIRVKMLAFMECLIKIAVLLELGILDSTQKKQYLHLYGNLPTTEQQLDSALALAYFLCKQTNISCEKIERHNKSILSSLKFSTVYNHLARIN